MRPAKVCGIKYRWPQNGLWYGKPPTVRIYLSAPFIHYFSLFCLQDFSASFQYHFIPYLFWYLYYFLLQCFFPPSASRLSVLSLSFPLSILFLVPWSSVYLLGCSFLWDTFICAPWLPLPCMGPLTLTDGLGLNRSLLFFLFVALFPLSPTSTAVVFAL